MRDIDFGRPDEDPDYGRPSGGRMARDDEAGDEVTSSVDLVVHNRRCDGTVVSNSFRYHRCPKCGVTVDTFRGNVV